MIDSMWLARDLVLDIRRSRRRLAAVGNLQAFQALAQSMDSGMLGLEHAFERVPDQSNKRFGWGPTR
jgi:hypothetical protein